MDQGFVFTDAQILNLICLQAIRASLAQDPITAAYKFNLSREQAACIGALDVRHLQALLANLQHVSLFVPRANLVKLLEMPPALAPVMASARAAPLEPFDPPDERRQNIDRTLSETIK